MIHYWFNVLLLEDDESVLIYYGALIRVVPEFARICQWVAIRYWENVINCGLLAELFQSACDVSVKLQRLTEYSNNTAFFQSLSHWKTTFVQTAINWVLYQILFSIFKHINWVFVLYLNFEWIDRYFVLFWLHFSFRFSDKTLWSNFFAQNCGTVYHARYTFWCSGRQKSSLNEEKTQDFLVIILRIKHDDSRIVEPEILMKSNHNYASKK